MTTLGQTEFAGSEKRILEGLRSRYEAQGFTFVVEPDPQALPGFLEAYRPDALAQKPGQNVVIEVKQGRSASADHSIARLREKLADRPDWRLDVVYAIRDSSPLETIPTTQLGIVRERLKDIPELSREGHQRAAFLVSWSLLEAALHALDGEIENKPRPAGAVVQSLAMQGYISPDVERRLRSLTELRNRIAHGDLSVEPSEGDVGFMLSAIEQALTSETV